MMGKARSGKLSCPCDRSCWDCSVRQISILGFFYKTDIVYEIVLEGKNPSYSNIL